MPISCMDVLHRLIGQSSEPTVVIAGLEYLSLADYHSLVEGSDNNSQGRWVERVDQQGQVNAALILSRDADATRRIHVQPKLHPADPEQIALVHAADNVLLFRHQDQRSGRGLNFCVQICSDFCNAQSVSTLRESISSSFADDLRLDLTFLLQQNPKQDVPQFRDGTNAYFDVADEKVDTKRGALLFVNNSSLAPSKSTYWGESQFRFIYNQWRPYGGEFTYRIEQVSGELWQAVTLREPGSGIYRITYKPAYLNSPRPGSGDVQPFETARHWPIRDDLRVEELGPVSFSYIPAVAHWLRGEWNESLKEMRQSASARQRDQVQGQSEATRQGEIVRRHIGVCSDCICDWLAVLDADGRKCEKAVRTYFWAFDGARGYPYAKDDFVSREPACWCPDATEAVKEWLKVHALLKIGAGPLEACNLEINPALGGHAALTDSLKVTYLWGGNQKSAASMVETYCGKMPPADRISGDVLLVLNAPSTRPDKSKLAARCKPIQESEPPAGSGSHLRPAGTVTRGEGYQLKVLYDHELKNALEDEDLGIFERLLADSVRAVVS